MSLLSRYSDPTLNRFLIQNMQLVSGLRTSRIAGSRLALIFWLLGREKSLTLANNKRHRTYGGSVLCIPNSSSWWFSTLQSYVNACYITSQQWVSNHWSSSLLWMVQIVFLCCRRSIGLWHQVQAASQFLHFLAIIFLLKSVTKEFQLFQLEVGQKQRVGAIFIQRQNLNLIKPYQEGILWH